MESKCPVLKGGKLSTVIRQDFETIKADKKTTTEALTSIKEGLECFDKLKDYLEQKEPDNRIRLVRNKFAAHYSKQTYKKNNQRSSQNENKTS